MAVRVPSDRCPGLGLPGDPCEAPKTGSFITRKPTRQNRLRHGKISHVPRPPSCSYAPFSDPGRTSPSGSTMAWCCSRPNNDESSHDIKISRLNSTAFELTVYASRPRVTSRACKTRFRLLAKLSRVGLATHRIAAKGFCLFPVVPLLWAFFVTQYSFFFVKLKFCKPLSLRIARQLLRQNKELPP